MGLKPELKASLEKILEDAKSSTPPKDWELRFIKWLQTGDESKSLTLLFMRLTRFHTDRLNPEMSEEKKKESKATCHQEKIDFITQILEGKKPTILGKVS